MPAQISPFTIAKIDDQDINISTMTHLIDQVRICARAARGFSVFTLNLDHLVKRRADATFRAAYHRATFVSADGAPVVALARWQGATISRTTGADLIDPLCELAASEGIGVYFFGSTRRELDAAATQLLKRHHGLKILGSEAPPFGFDPLSEAAVAAGQRVAQSGAHFCLIALGAPKQEILADRWLAQHPQIGCFCIGAALNFVAGGQKRAPVFMQRLGLEWLWRLASDPRRLFIRYSRCALLLADLVLRSASNQIMRHKRV